MKLVHYSAKPVERVRSAAQRKDSMGMKPTGLWVSCDGFCMNWRAWCEAESFGLASLACIHDVKLRRGANILRIKDAAGIDRFTKAYGEQFQSLRLDWARVAKLYQGIVIAPYIWSRRLHDSCDWYYGWDCASGCIWDADAVKSITLIQPTFAQWKAQQAEAGAP